MKAIENKQFLCSENKFGKCLLAKRYIGIAGLRIYFLLEDTVIHFLQSNLVRSEKVNTHSHLNYLPNLIF